MRIIERIKALLSRIRNKTPQIEGEKQVGPDDGKAEEETKDFFKRLRAPKSEHQKTYVTFGDLSEEAIEELIAEAELDEDSFDKSAALSGTVDGKAFVSLPKTNGEGYTICTGNGKYDILSSKDDGKVTGYSGTEKDIDGRKSEFTIRKGEITYKIDNKPYYSGFKAYTIGDSAFHDDCEFRGIHEYGENLSAGGYGPRFLVRTWCGKNESIQGGYVVQAFDSVEEYVRGEDPKMINVDTTEVNLQGRPEFVHRTFFKILPGKYQVTKDLGSRKLRPGASIVWDYDKIRKSVKGIPMKVPNAFDEALRSGLQVSLPPVVQQIFDKHKSIERERASLEGDTESMFK